MNAVRKLMNVESHVVCKPIDMQSDFFAVPKDADSHLSPAIAAQVMLARRLGVEADFAAMPQRPSEQLFRAVSASAGLVCYFGGLAATVGFILKSVV